MRLGSFPFAARTVTKPWPIPGKHGAHLPVGTRVYLNIAGITVDPDYFPEPQTFRPERFSNDTTQSHPPMAFQPFGSGPRMCIGMHIAKLESKFMLFHLIKSFRLSPGNKLQVPLKFGMEGFAHPVGGVGLKVENRS